MVKNVIKQTKTILTVYICEGDKTIKILDLCTFDPHYVERICFKHILLISKQVKNLYKWTSIRR